MAPSTEISILIVGAGVGGLMSALECRRKGHDVRIIERSPVPSTAGDFFSIAPHVIRHFYNAYPDLAAECDRINYPTVLSYHKLTGEARDKPQSFAMVELEATLPDGTKKTATLQRQNRPKFVAALIAQAQRLGIDITFGKQVVDYFEQDKKAGVVLEDGAQLTADLVIAADGIGTKSNKLVNGKEIRAYPSGFSVFRTAFPVELAIEDPEIAARWPLIDNQISRMEMWQGEDMHFTVQRFSDIMSWGLLHKDMGTGLESWHQPVDVSKVLEITAQLPGFPEVANRLILSTPKDGIIDWSLMWRDSRENYVSPLGRVVQVGDSAHTFLPSSGAGANTAVEDAITLAACLQIGGKSNIAWATKVHTKLRFERVSCLQLQGFINHQRQNNGTLNIVGNNGVPFKVTIGRWYVEFDAEKYAYENYGKAFGHMVSGAPFQNTNTPPGYTYKPWTIQELFEDISHGKTLQFAGDWS